MVRGAEPLLLLLHLLGSLLSSSSIFPFFSRSALLWSAALLRDD